MFDSQKGMMDPKTGTIFVVNVVEADAKWVAAADTLWGTKVVNMYTTLRFIIEKVWLGGAFSAPVAMTDWVSGFQTEEYKRFTVGDYYDGAWKDLTGFVSPVFKENYPLLSQSVMNMHTGNRDADETTMMRLVNKNPFANKLQNFYTGADFVKTSVNPHGKQRQELSVCTNGKQFKPFVTKEDRICYYDNLDMRNYEFKQTEDKKAFGDLQAVLMSGEDNFLSSTALGVKSALDSSHSFQLPFVTTQFLCKGCDPSLFKNLKVDGKAFVPDKTLTHDFEMRLNPDTGFMTFL